MAIIPTLVSVFVFLQVCSGSEHTTAVPESTTEKFECPGQCIEEHLCSMVLKDSDCSDELVCCVQQDETLTTTEYAEYFTTEDNLEYSSFEDGNEEAEVAVQEQDSDQTISYTYAEEGADAEDPDYTYVFSEESDDFPLRRTGEVQTTCEGKCLNLAASLECDYMLAMANECPEGLFCCLTAEHVAANSELYRLFNEPKVSDGQDAVVKRDVQSPDTCPGTCVHPSHALFCGQILTQFSCPLDSICCIRGFFEESMKVFQCTGQCLPTKMQGYCFPPNELILGPTTCKSGTICCMQKTSGSRVQPPSIVTMQFPNAQYEAPSDPSQVVLGHLAVDEEGTVFRVGTDGQVSPLPRVARIDHLRATYNKLMVYPQSGGHIVIYSDSTGALYQQFYPNMTYDPDTPFGRKPSSSRTEKAHAEKPVWKPVVKRPTEEEFSPQDFDAFPEFQQKPSPRKPTHTEKEANLQEFDTLPEGPEDVIIPEDDDEALVVESKPSVTDSETGRPTCPGSCLSFFLRFTCFRGHAIYDGYSCPGRSVCCARVADIENREKLLRSLSPFSPESTESGTTAPVCGMKGRDSQHAVSGSESLPGEWCWQVAVINVQNQYMCGGALMGDSWVITAAHCVAGAMKENQAIFVRAGVTDLKSHEENVKGQTIRVVSTFIHRNFNSINLDNNIALLKLQKPVELGDGVCVVCLPMSGQMPAGNVKCTVTGYGFVSKEGEMSLKIKAAEVPIVDDTECMANVTEALVNPFILPASSFCAGGEGKQDACQGDAGGPLTCDINGHHELIGLVSWTLGCGKDDVPSIYVKIPAFVGWIHEVVSSSSYLTALH